MLDPCETGTVSQLETELEYPLAYILVKMQRTHAAGIEGLQEGVLLIEPAK